MRSPPQVSSNQEFWHWSSPLPYLFVGLGLMILLITVALIILVCSFRKRSTSDEKAPPPPAAPAVADNSPKIVVIMAGDDNPTHLAIPMPPAAASFPTSQTCVCNV
ncbi:protein GLUTAMINE DUMPER 6-like [Salvia divinorum]|uniref:Protein GLUTAMINE DUMPER 6-like n=1 Tax=Salvia divinorum TaxID=28513 RepID=A0ABD1G785_SALDI